MDIKYDVWILDGTPDFTFNLINQKYIIIDGQKQNINGPEVVTVMPGDINKIKEIAPEYLPMFRILWADKITNHFIRRLTDAKAGIDVSGHKNSNELLKEIVVGEND